LLYERDYDALIVRINSPGGGAQASDVIWHKLRTLSMAGIPVVASIGDVGASGGYYIACGADRFWLKKQVLLEV
jgi:protease-4